ncbi:Unannotated [Lentimonas sp. CC19]|nr:Unannotated [Lentimonas sp. CC19]CAA6696083.1 Unannotated [Lentimonas sp. CC10]CAA7070079.1 Unannotated [Lentimonas sp. CC11]
MHHARGVVIFQRLHLVFKLNKLSINRTHHEFLNQIKIFRDAYSMRGSFSNFECHR